MLVKMCSTRGVALVIFLCNVVLSGEVIAIGDGRGAENPHDSVIHFRTNPNNSNANDLRIEASVDERQGKIVQNGPPGVSEAFNEWNRDLGVSYANLGKNLANAFGILPTRVVAVLVNDNRMAHESAETCVHNLMSNPYLKLEFLLIKFNASGASPILSSSGRDRQSFMNLLKYKKGNTTSEYIGLDSENGSVPFFAILQAVRQLRPSSAILMFTNGKVLDEDISHLALKELQNNRIRLFCVWQGPSFQKEEAILKETVALTGEFFYVQDSDESQSKSLLSYLKEVDVSMPKALVLYRTYLKGPKSFTIPISSGVKSIHLTISEGARIAKLTSNHGDQIDLFSKPSVSRFSRGSFLEKTVGASEVHLNTLRPTSASIAGIWRLDVGDASAHGYNVTISLQDNLKISSYSSTGTKDKAITQFTRKKGTIKLGVQGSLQSIDNVTFENTRGETVGVPVSFSLRDRYETLDEDVENVDTELLNDKEIDIKIKDIPHDPFLIKVNGKDKLGTSFVRLTYFNGDGRNNQLPPISIDVGVGSELLTSPNRLSNVYFEVTNNHDQVIFVQFFCRDSKSLLAGMQPRIAWLSPKQRLIVTVNVYTQPWAGNTYENQITFSANGPTRAEKTALLKVSNQRPIDNERPHMWHKYTSDCTNNIIGRCEDASWSIEVTAQDKETGLLQVTTGLTTGLFFRNGFTSGTKEEVIGYYSGSCCESTLQLTAVDLNNNRRTYVADAYRATLSAGTIAAIVLGIIILLIIIIIIVVIIKCRKKESGSLDLPTYRGPSTRY